jgi:hypothetical protein
MPDGMNTGSGVLGGLRVKSDQPVLPSFFECHGRGVLRAHCPLLTYYAASDPRGTRTGGCRQIPFGEFRVLNLTQPMFC